MPAKLGTIRKTPEALAELLEKAPPWLQSTWTWMMENPDVGFDPSPGLATMRTLDPLAKASWELARREMPALARFVEGIPELLTLSLSAPKSSKGMIGITELLPSDQLISLKLRSPMAPWPGAESQRTVQNFLLGLGHELGHALNYRSYLNRQGIPFYAVPKTGEVERVFPLEYFYGPYEAMGKMYRAGIPLLRNPWIDPEEAGGIVFGSLRHQLMSPEARRVFSSVPAAKTSEYFDPLHSALDAFAMSQLKGSQYLLRPPVPFRPEILR